MVQMKPLHIGDASYGYVNPGGKLTMTFPEECRPEYLFIMRIKIPDAH